jgi:integrase
VELQALMLSQFACFRDSVLQRCSPITFNNCRRHLIAIANFAVETGELQKNPFKWVKPVAVKSSVPKRMSQAVIHSIMHDIQTQTGSHSPIRGHWAEPIPYWLAVFKLFYYTGMRRRQMAGLRWEDIDFEADTLRMAYHSSKTANEWFIPLPSLCKQDLQTLKALSLQHDPNLSGSDRVFVLTRFNAGDRQYATNPSIKTSEGQISAFFKRVQAHTGTNVSAHKIRHTTASELMGKTNNPKLVQSLMGHRHISTTLLYVHPNMQEMKALVSLL